MKKQFLIFIILVSSVVFLNTFLEKILLGDLVLNDNTLLNTKKITSQKLFENSIDTIKKNYIDKDLNGQNLDKWKSHYKDKIKNDEDSNVAINTVLETLDDPYSKYLDKKTYAEQNSSINSKIIGIGVNIATIGGKTYIINVLEGTPAEKSGLKDGDIILKVDDEDITGLKTSDVADRVRGKIDTIVKLYIMRDKNTLTKKITRKDIKIKNVKSKLNEDIGYIQVLSFIGATTTDEFIEALIKTSPAKGLIIDLRGNSGGLLPNAIYMANLFIKEGNLVSIVGRNGFKKEIKAQKLNFTINKPVVLLINEGSASASEIFSGALRDYNKAIIVGTKSYGKGMVQRIIPMPNETGINLTIAKYLTPKNIDINKKGIEPDLKVPEIKGKKDVQLEVAENIIKDLTN